MFKFMTWKRGLLLSLLLVGIFLASPVYNYCMRQITKAKIAELGGKVDYRAAYYQLPKFIGSKRFKLPGSFSTEVLNLELGAWSNGFTHLNCLGDFSQVHKVVLRSPENVSPEVHDFWKEKPWIKQIDLHGEGDFLECLSNLGDSSFQQIELHHHELTQKEAMALKEMKNLLDVKLSNTNGSSEAIKQLKNSSLNLVYIIDNFSSPDGKFEDAADFFKAYGPVDVLHWNYNPWFNMGANTGPPGTPIEGKQLALGFTSRIVSPVQTSAIWARMDTSEINMLVLDISRSYYPFRITENWTKARMQNVKSIRNINTYLASGNVNLEYLFNFVNLENLEHVTWQKITNIHLLINFPKLKRLIIPNTPPAKGITKTLLELHNLETVQVPNDSITLSELEQLLQKSSLKTLMFSSDSKALQVISPEETKALCGKHGWTYKSVQDGSFFRYTLVRDKSEQNNE